MTKALVILSGGQDSTLCLALACEALGSQNVAAITFNYGQRHLREIQAACDVVKIMGVTQHEILDLGSNILAGTSPLTDPSKTLEQYENFGEMDRIIGTRVEKTFVPMRNALFLTIAANRAVCLGAEKVYTGVCQADNANYPDCRESFIKAQNVTVNEALGFSSSPEPGEPWLQIVTPLMHWSKAESICESLCLPGAYESLAFTHTAYDGQYPPVGNDHATLLRAQGFLEAGIPDPLVVRAAMDGLMEYPQTMNYSSSSATIKQLRLDIERLRTKFNVGAY